MLARFSRQRVVGGLIVVLAVTLCIAPLFSRGHAESAEVSENAAASADINHAAHYPPADPLAPPSHRYPVPSTLPSVPSIDPVPTSRVTSTGLSEHVVDSKSFQLVSTKYRLTTAKAKSLAQFLEEQVGRPEIFEISVEEPEAITVVASPAAQKTIGELLNLMRTSPGKARELRPTPTEN